MARAAYVEYLGSISQMTHEMRALRQHDTLTRAERIHESGRILTESGAYEARQQVHIISPHLAGQTDALFDALRALRDRFDELEPGTDAEWSELLDHVTTTMDALRDAMHDSLK